MRVAKLKVNNFRGVQSADLFFPIGSTVIIGDNNIGKSTVLEALELVLGPERLSRRPIIDEHDFYASRYLDQSNQPIPIRIEVIVVGLSPEQQAAFNANLEWWNTLTKELVEHTNQPEVIPALRVVFVGEYDADEDDFTGSTFFSHPELESDKLTPFSTSNKRECGFLYLRALRTGTRALSLEKGSLLDIILRLKDVRPNMWEKVLNDLRPLPVAADPSIGLSEIFTGIQAAMKKYVPSEWGTAPQITCHGATACCKVKVWFATRVPPNEVMAERKNSA